MRKRGERVLIGSRRVPGRVFRNQREGSSWVAVRLDGVTYAGDSYDRFHTDVVTTTCRPVGERD